MTERALKSLRVPVKQLRRECNPAVFKFRTTAELAPHAAARKNKMTRSFTRAHSSNRRRSSRSD